MTADFTARTGAALVIGGSGGIGLAITRLLASRGSDVAVTFRSRPEAGELAVESAREWGVRASAHALDLTAHATAAAVVAEVAETYGGLHTLVYAAGPPVPMAHLSSVSPAEMAEQLAARPRSEYCWMKIEKGTDNAWRAFWCNLGGNNFKLVPIRREIPR